MKLIAIISISVVGALVTIGCAQAVILKVPDQYPTISDACQAAMAGDTVGVYPGTYSEGGINVRSGVTVFGMGSDSTDVRIDAPPLLEAFYAMTGEAPVLLENMDLRGHEGMIILSSNDSLRVQRCCLHLVLPETIQGVAIVQTWCGNASIKKCHITFGLLAEQEEHIFVPYQAGRFVLEDCVVQTSELGYLSLWGETRPGTVYEFRNNTIFGRFHSEYYSWSQYESSLYAVNNIIQAVICFAAHAPDTLEWRHNCFIEQGPPPDCGYQIGNFVADPLFCEPAAGDYRLQPESPCIGAGEHGENVGARLGICWPTDVVALPKPVAEGLLWRLLPNPTTGGVAIHLDGARWTSDPCPIEIFDVTGKLVRLLGPPDWESNVRAHWDGRLADGRDAPAGVYHIRIGRAEEEQNTRRLIMLR